MLYIYIYIVCSFLPQQNVTTNSKTQTNSCPFLPLPLCFLCLFLLPFLFHLPAGSTVPALRHCLYPPVPVWQGVDGFGCADKRPIHPYGWTIHPSIRMEDPSIHMNGWSIRPSIWVDDPSIHYPHGWTIHLSLHMAGRFIHAPTHPSMISWNIFE